jgi:hypothetical protein
MISILKCAECFDMDVGFEGGGKRGAVEEKGEKYGRRTPSPGKFIDVLSIMCFLRSFMSGFGVSFFCELRRMHLCWL